MLKVDSKQKLCSIEEKKRILHLVSQ